jgi:hypothetical protein
MDPEGELTDGLKYVGQISLKVKNVWCFIVIFCSHIIYGIRIRIYPCSFCPIFCTVHLWKMHNAIYMFATDDKNMHSVYQ